MADWGDAVVAPDLSQSHIIRTIRGALRKLDTERRAVTVPADFGCSLRDQRKALELFDAELAALLQREREAAAVKTVKYMLARGRIAPSSEIRAMVEEIAFAGDALARLVGASGGDHD